MRERIDVTVAHRSRSADLIRRHVSRVPDDERTVEEGVRKVRAALDRLTAGTKRFQVDCHWPDLRQIVELDGWKGYRTRTAFREDRARDRKLKVAGYSVTHLTWNQLDDEPAAIAADLRALLMENEAA